MIKSKDKNIINQLRENARSNLSHISKKTGVPISTIHDRMKLIDRHILKHSSLLNFSTFGLIQATLLIKLEQDQKRDFQTFLKDHSNINSAYRVDNMFDFVVEGIFKEMKNLHEFVDSIENRFKVKEKQLFHVVSTIKKEDYKII